MGKKDPLQALVGRGGGTGRKLLMIGVGIALVVIVVKFPADAARWVHDGFDTVAGAIDGLVSFIRQAA